MRKGKRQPKLSGRTRRPRCAARPWLAGAVFGFAVLAASLAAGYLAQVNAVSGKSERMRGLEREIAELKEEREKLELMVATERSMRSVEERVKTLGMVPAAEIEYVAPTAPVVAKR